MVDLAFELYMGLMEYAIPIAVVFEVSNLLIGIFLRAAFGGKLWVGR